MYRILFLCSLFSIWNYTTLFSIFFCDCCKDCCDYCNPDIITEEDLITEEDILKAEENYKYPEEIEITTQKILIHLKLDNGKLNDIAVEINNIQDNEEKIKKIIEYSKDIDWENECCPNILIRWEKNECAIIANFDLMLNNPYFLKFFLICNDTMRREDTYVLNAICDLVKYCVEHPKFEWEYRGSVDEIAKAFFRKEGEEYYYVEKENEEIQKTGEPGPHLREYYYGFKDEDVKLDPHFYNGRQSIDVFNWICRAFSFDLELKNDNLKMKISNLFSEYYTFNLKKKDISEIFLFKKENDEITKTLLTKTLKTHKLLGIRLVQEDYHLFSLINHNSIWYNKNTLHLNECRKMTIREVLNLFNEILKIKKPTYKQFNKEHCEFLFVKKNQNKL